MDQEGERRFDAACADVIAQIIDGAVDRDDVEQAKLDACGTYSSPKVPTNGDILAAAPDDKRDQVEPVLRRKPVRTASGVTPVAVMTSPEPCPHGKCLYCPGGPASEFSSAQSYTGHEPAAARAEQNEYDPYGQVTLRLAQLRHIGHPVEKVELIVMGGTMTARDPEYQEWFVRRAIQAMNEFDPDDPPAPTEDKSFAQSPEEETEQSLEAVLAENETATVRNVSTTFETKPDWCGPDQIDRMLRLGVTKVEVGVQTTFEGVHREMHRGHGVQDAIDAGRRLRDAGFKVGFHLMPGQPGTSVAMAREDARRLFEDSNWRPDYLKIYPTLVVRGTRIYDMWRDGEFDPLDNEQAAKLVAEIKANLPPYVRLQRVQRDIPADFIDAGVWKSNLRQIARERMDEHGWTCDCVRCREVGMSDDEPKEIDLSGQTYEAGGGTEHFISFEDADQDLLIGFLRLRFPGAARRSELEDAAVIRELHVYGNEVGLGKTGEEFQHKGYGKRLVREAERRAREAGVSKLVVIAGIGAREYYREELEYEQDGPYVSTSLD
ncbi:tRNA uridine(34) 5-carboxymethylaminomethyl modification radical SAM/GNAT enzyme Elp3 [Halodesulfurarchaeum sp.]|uniref:tRNA uridine(34) 5-carboxymethylaminomethyl modification radical SAM/GNAT enzyme Elp3 n=1 Tax=Halodesulfurarchaeum sp. TaxID=1980530 RepID=UPI002FC31527